MYHVVVSLLINANETLAFDLLFLFFKSNLKEDDTEWLTVSFWKMNRVDPLVIKYTHLNLCVQSVLLKYAGFITWGVCVCFPEDLERQNFLERDKMFELKPML